MKAKKILFFCCLLGGQLLAMEKKPSQALAVKKSGEVGVVGDKDSVEAAVGFDAKSERSWLDRNFSSGLVSQKCKEDRNCSSETNLLCNQLCCMHALYEKVLDEDISESCAHNRGMSREAAKWLPFGAYEKWLDCKGEKAVVERIKRFVSRLSEIQHSKDFKHLCSFADISSRKVEEMSNRFRSDFVRFSPKVNSWADVVKFGTTDSWAIMERISAIFARFNKPQYSRFSKNSIGPDYRRAFAEVMGEDYVAGKETFELLKTCLENSTRGKERLGSQWAWYGAHRAEEIRTKLQRDLKILSDPAGEKLIEALVRARDIANRLGGEGWISIEDYQKRFKKALALVRTRNIANRLGGEGWIVIEDSQESVEKGEIFGLLDGLINDLVALKKSSLFADVTSFCGVTAADFDSILTNFQRSRRIFSNPEAEPLGKVLVLALRMEEHFLRKDIDEGRSIEDYQACFAAVGDGKLDEVKALALLKERIDNLEALKRSPFFDDVMSACEVTVTTFDKLLAGLQKDWAIFSDPECMRLAKVLAFANAVERIASTRDYRTSCFDRGARPTLEDYQRSFAEAMGRAVQKEEVLGLLKKCIDDFAAAKRSPHFADVVKIEYLDEEVFDSTLKFLQRDWLMLSNPECARLARLLDFASWVNRKACWHRTGVIVFDSDVRPTLEDCRYAFSAEMKRDVGREEVIGLLKKCVDDLAAAKRSPYLADVFRFTNWDEEQLNFELSLLQRHLQDLTEAEAKSGAAAVGNAETKGK